MKRYSFHLLFSYLVVQDKCLFFFPYLPIFNILMDLNQFQLLSLFEVQIIPCLANRSFFKLTPLDMAQAILTLP